MGANQALSHAETQILVRILKEKEITETQIKDEAIKQKLTQMKLITYVPKKGSQRLGRYKLTDLGKDIAQQEHAKPIPKPKKTVKAKPKPTRLTVAGLKQEMDMEFQSQNTKLEHILHRLGLIEERLAITGSGASQLVTIDEADLPKILKEVYELICSTEPRFSNLIPLSAIKPKLYEKYHLSNDLVDKTLLNLEKTRQIDLQVAYDEGSVTGAEYGIKIPGRGLVFYVRWRK